jgi:hypothetical protein
VAGLQRKKQASNPILRKFSRVKSYADAFFVPIYLRISKIDFVSCQGYFPVYNRLALNPPSGFFFVLPFYNLYLFLKKPSKKDTSVSLRSNPRGYSSEPIFSVYARASMRA